MLDGLIESLEDYTKELHTWTWIHMPFKSLSYGTDASIIKLRCVGSQTVSRLQGALWRLGQGEDSLVDKSLHKTCPRFFWKACCKKEATALWLCLPPATIEPMKYSSSSILGHSGKERRIPTMSLLWVQPSGPKPRWNGHPKWVAFHPASIYGRNSGSAGDRGSPCLLPGLQAVTPVEDSRLGIQELGCTPGPAATMTLSKSHLSGPHFPCRGWKGPHR